MRPWKLDLIREEGQPLKSITARLYTGNKYVYLWDEAKGPSKLAVLTPEVKLAAACLNEWSRSHTTEETFRKAQDVLPRVEEGAPVSDLFDEDTYSAGAAALASDDYLRSIKTDSTASQKK